MIDAHHGDSFAQRQAEEDELQRALRMSALWAQQQAHLQGLADGINIFAKPKPARWAPKPGKEDEVMITVCAASRRLSQTQAADDAANEEAIMRHPIVNSQQLTEEPVAPSPESTPRK